MASELADDAPLVVFHQCMDAEWGTWGRESALEFAKQGFAVIRVKSRPWEELEVAFFHSHTSRSTNAE